MADTATGSTEQSEPILERPGSRSIAEPSPAAQSRIDAIRADKDFFAVGTPRQKQLAEEMHALMTGAGDSATSDESENRRAINNLNRGGKLVSDDPRVRAEAMAELRKRLALEATDEERADAASASVESLRSRFGLSHDDAVLPSLRERWDSGAEQQALAALQEAGVDQPAVEAIYDFYSSVYNGALGDVGNVSDVDDVIAQFRVVAKKHGVSAELTEALVRWQLGRLQ